MSAMNRTTMLTLMVAGLGASVTAAQDPGACCLPDDTQCHYLTADDCIAHEGSYLGPGTDCSMGFCCPAACCLPDGSCEVLTMHECMLEYSGMWWGTGPVCGQIDCEPMRACCVPDFGCIEVPPTTCMMELNGTPQPFGTTCAPDPCPPNPPQACCMPDGSCWDMRSMQELSECMLQEGMAMETSCAMTFCLPTEACCMGIPWEETCLNFMPIVCSMSGGTPLGPGTKCSTTTLCGAAACCLDDGTCELKSMLGCTHAGGNFVSGESFCTSTTCDPQACCYGDDPCAGAFCEEVPLGYCVESGGSPLGPGAVCAGWPCGPGACCLPKGTCEELTSVECLAKGGEGKGSGRVCAAVSCEPFDAGACCLGATECVITREKATCVDQLGGSFLGFGTGCPTQTLKYFSEPGGDVCNHAIVTVVNCPEPDTLRDVPCEPDPGPKLDMWSSPEDATMCHNFGVPGSPAIPAGFFGEGSDEYFGPVCLRGVPLGTVELDDFGTLDVGNVDTLIRRDADPFDRCSVPSGTGVTVGIEMAALNLEAVAPIIVSYNEGKSFAFWSATADLSAVHTDSDPSNDPPTGALAAERTHCNGGTYTSVLLVQPRFTFVNDDDPGDVRILDTGLEGIDPVVLDASTLPSSWVLDVHPSLATANPVCTAFHPGLDQDEPELVCDCNSNDIRDKCDIESGFSVDCNTNEVPDSCDIADGSSGDCNTNFVPDECDIAGEVSLDCNATRIPDECETIGNFNFDDRDGVDLRDFVAFAESTAGPGLPPKVSSPSCFPALLAAFDSDADIDLDLVDFAALQRAFGNGP